MNWLSLVSQIYMQYVAQQRKLEAAPEKLKGMSVQAGIYFVGLVSCVVFTVAAVIMFFIDLGHQWDAGLGTHFSGFMQSALLLFLLGLVIFAIAVGVAKSVSRKQAEKEALQKLLKAQEEAATPPINPMLVFGQEFLKALLNSKPKH